MALSPDMMTLFDNVYDEELEKIEKKLKYEDIPSRQCIINQSYTNHKLYLVREGKVKASIEGKASENRSLRIIHEGECFGDISIFNDKYPIANYYSMTHVKLFSMSHEDFLRILNSSKRISRNHMQIIIRRLKHYTSIIMNYGQKNCTYRVANIILNMAEDFGYRLKNTVVVNQCPYQHDIASLAGTTRETVSRAYRELEEKDYIVREGRNIIIKNYVEFLKLFSI